MNFFGHAVLAAARASGSEFVLGSMLPDFISILGVRPPRLEMGTLARGVAFHHRTDAVFHDSAVFRSLQRQASEQLLAQGVRRGPVRAVAHVGVELLIDAALAWSLETESTAAGASYLDALDLGSLPLTSLSPRAWNEGQRLMFLCQRLRQAGVERFRVDADGAMTELSRILARRPRLALVDAEAAAVRGWATQAFVVVKADLPLLLDELKNGLERQLA